MSLSGPSHGAKHPNPGPLWQRLSVRVIWVDLAQTILSTLPAVIAIWVVGVDPSSGQIWPLIGLAVVGLIGAIADGVRWGFTRYRVTETHVELKTGVFLRAHRAIQRDRIRTVDVEAKLRHRLAGLRLVNIGAGQQASAGESAVTLDALTTADAQSLQSRLLSPSESQVEPESPTEPHVSASDSAAPTRSRDQSITVLASFQPRWVIHNMMNIWAYILAIGLGWGVFWLLGSFGVDVTGFVSGLLDWESIGWFTTVGIVLLAVTLVGAVGLAVTFFSEHWNFRLARTPGPDGTLLQTRQGLFTTREINRDENRIRGAQISEPLLWRWMGTADTSVLTTGLNMWSMSAPATILPRGPVTLGRQVAAAVLGTEAPFAAILSDHPPAALRRRLWWATAFMLAVGLVLTWLAWTGVLPYQAIWAAAALWPIALGAAFVAYRTLGHAIAGPYLVTRSGLVARATTVLQRSAVSTIVIRESLLQRRLGLRSVSAMTAAGYGGYDTPDIDKSVSIAFAAQVAPGVLEPFLIARPTGGDAATETSDHQVT